MISVNFNGVINATVPVEGISNGIKISGNAVFDSSLKLANIDGQFIDVEKQESVGSFNMYDGGKTNFSFDDFSQASNYVSVFDELLTAIDAKTKEGIMLTAPVQEPAENQ